MKLTLIVAADKNFGIGINGDMLFYISDDLNRFKELTTNNIIIMGRGTFEALPNSKELPERINIILSSKNIETSTGIVVDSIGNLQRKLQEINPKNEKEEFLIGGGNLIKNLWSSIDRALITIVDKAYTNVDTYIPNIFEDKDFEIVKISKERYDEKNRFYYKYYEFKRIKDVSL
ncbi:dihydrofolate reductase [Miniphocaeibacter massiliensis]|uniref:dihydrofolate reductase n=1 Tax=Miniphocaeibacter massiliensis TaxID=2041841 RepID=UPI000C1B988F|nr:dihydrofolate reductase [Miniphocaeibacter massiliensis]